MVNSTTRVAVETKIGRIVFRAKPNGAFIARCQGQDRIRIRERNGRWEADANGTVDETNTFTKLAASSPELAYKRAVKAFWL